MNIYDFLIENSHVFINFFIILFFSLAIFALLVSKKFSTYLTNNNVNNIQNIHIGTISRLGGIGLLFSIMLICFLTKIYSNNFIFFYILLCGIPLIGMALVEDLIQNINPIIRLITIFISPLIFVIIFKNTLPIIDIPLLSYIINLPFINIIFFSLCLVAYINGTNFIDGTNGLASFTILTSLLCLLFLSLSINDIFISEILIYLIAALVGFIFYNYPFGKIFLGDLGSYILGFFVGIITVLLMGRNPELPNWSAVCILSYPIIEVIFSFIRKLQIKKSPLYPDNKHLHLKLYFTLNARINNPIIANAFVAPFLSLIWLMPLVLLPWIYTNKFLIISAVSIQIFIYLSFYKFIPEEL